MVVRPTTLKKKDYIYCIEADFGIDSLNVSGVTGTETVSLVSWANSDDHTEKFTLPDLRPPNYLNNGIDLFAPGSSTFQHKCSNVYWSGANLLLDFLDENGYVNASRFDSLSQYPFRYNMGSVGVGLIGFSGNSSYTIINNPAWDGTANGLRLRVKALSDSLNNPVFYSHPIPRPCFLFC